MDARSIWQATMGQLQLQLDRPTFDTWVKNTAGISYEDGVLIVGVRTAYAKDWLENRLYATIQRCVTGIANRTTSVRFIVQRNGSVDQEQVDLLESQPSADSTWQDLGDRESSRVNEKYTFDTFIIGQANRLAYAGCRAVAENPGMAYNPLFVYGGVGLGKTHLLFAIGNYALQHDRRVLYVSAERFANEMIQSIRTRSTEAFRAKYRTIDVLLIDDVQFIINKEATQEEFFHTFNDLYQSNRQIVLSSDRSPKAFVGLEERLRSRFEWGLTADVQPPDVETRMAILAVKAEARHINLPAEVIEFIAEQVQSNIRELEGALNRVLALARMMEYPLTVDTAQKALNDVMRPPVKVSDEDILAIVSTVFGVPVDEILGRRRNRDIARARQVAMYLTRELTDMSLPQIGNAMGGRDHTTVMHGINKIAALFERDEVLRQQVLEVKSKLYGAKRAPSYAARVVQGA